MILLKREIVYFVSHKGRAVLLDVSIQGWFFKSTDVNGTCMLGATQ
jgi:hypothetical protein